MLPILNSLAWMTSADINASKITTLLKNITNFVNLAQTWGKGGAQSSIPNQFCGLKVEILSERGYYFLVNAFSRIILSNFIEIKWKRNSGKGFFRMDVNSMWPCAPDILDKVNGIAWAFKDPDFQLVSRCHRMYLWIKHFLLNDGPYLLT